VAAATERYTSMMTGRPHLPEVWAEHLFGERQGGVAKFTA
jgi:hypothetical protein